LIDRRISNEQGRILSRRWRFAASPGRNRERIMLLKMIGQGLLAGVIVAALAFGYQTYREGQVGGSLVSGEEHHE
jgi:transposase